MRFVIVGAGLAGHRAAMHLRELASDAEITLLGDELTLPYDRPPLSKEVLAGGAPEFLATQETYDRNAVVYCSGERVIRIDRENSQIETASGAVYSYDRLLLASGSRPRHLPDRIGRSRKVIYLRTLDDSLALRCAVKAGRRIAIIGGGFIGLEVAAAARGAGAAVVLLEMERRLLSRGMPTVLSDWARTKHRSHGVDLRLETSIQSIIDLPNGRLRLDWSGGFDEVDWVVAGIGVEPNIELASEAGLLIDSGIVVDDRCQTSDPRIFAAGEVTCHPTFGGLHRRLESWRVASEQSLVAAKSMLGQPAKYAEPPWLWSDQFGHNIQSLGVSTEHGRPLMLGDATTDRWTAIFLDGKRRIAGAVAVNNGRDIGMLKRAMMKDGQIPEPLLARANGCTMSDQARCV